MERSNTELSTLQGLENIKNLLLKNEYPLKVVDECIKKVQCPVIRETKDGYIGNKNGLKLSYIDEQHRGKLLEVLKGYNIIEEQTKIVFTPGPKVGDLLITSKLNPLNAMSMIIFVMCVFHKKIPFIAR